MTNFLIRLFVGKNQDPNQPAVRGKYASLAGFTGILLNVLLFAGKLTKVKILIIPTNEELVIARETVELL